MSAVLRSRENHVRSVVLADSHLTSPLRYHLWTTSFLVYREITCHGPIATKLFGAIQLTAEPVLRQPVECI